MCGLVGLPDGDLLFKFAPSGAESVPGWTETIPEEPGVEASEPRAAKTLGAESQGVRERSREGSGLRPSSWERGAREGNARNGSPNASGSADRGPQFGGRDEVLIEFPLPIFLDAQYMRTVTTGQTSWDISVWKLCS